MPNYESQVINGQLVPVAPAQAFSPLAYGTTLSGPGYWPRGGQYNLPPLLPNPVATTGVANYSPDFGEGAQYGPDGQPLPTSGSVSSSGKVNWYHPTKSPVLWAIGFVVLSLFLLHKIHYKS